MSEVASELTAACERHWRALELAGVKVVRPSTFRVFGCRGQSQLLYRSSQLAASPSYSGRAYTQLTDVTIPARAAWQLTPVLQK